MTFWIKNNDPAAWTVPFSVEKRTGFGIAFKDEEIWAFTKHRPRYPAGTDWVADGVSHPFTSTRLDTRCLCVSRSLYIIVHQW
jgi:hypothetical protein